MSDEELSPKLQALLDSERTPPPLSNERRTAMLQGIEARLAGGSAPGGGAEPTASGPGAPAPDGAAGLGARVVRTFMVLAVGGAIGAGAHAQLAEPRVVEVPVPAAVTVASVATSVPSPHVERETVAPTPDPGLGPSATSKIAPSTSSNVATGTGAPGASTLPEARPEAPARGSSIGAERALLERGRAALARRDALSALEALAEHARSFPEGKLAEEREALAVQALAALGRHSDARRKADAFHARYPGSLFTARVDATIRELSARPTAPAD